jgi:hypothetical protein
LNIIRRVKFLFLFCSFDVHGRQRSHKVTYKWPNMMRIIGPDRWIKRQQQNDEKFFQSYLVVISLSSTREFDGG